MAGAPACGLPNEPASALGRGSENTRLGHAVDGRTQYSGTCRSTKSRCPLRRIPVSTLLFSLLFALILTCDSWGGPQIRVLVGNSLSRARSSGQGLRVIDGLGRETLLGRRVTVRPTGAHSFHVTGIADKLPGPLGIVDAKNLPALSGSVFRGSFEIRSHGSGRMNVINLIDLEDYLCGLLNSEMPASWPGEALKAQAVAGRTYALWKQRHSTDRYHLVSTTQDQVYNGAAGEDHRAVAAVRDTSGWYMAYQGTPILAYYHSCCGGHTDPPAGAKAGDHPYIKGVQCRWCMDSPKFRWERTFAEKRLARALTDGGYHVDSVESVLPLTLSGSRRVLDLEVITPHTTFFMTGEQLRSTLGYAELPSTRFSVLKQSKRFLFSGTGYGHGLGACQYGMKGLAQHGLDWRKILGFYYKGVQFKRLNDSAEH